MERINMIINPCGFPNCKSADCEICPHNKIKILKTPEEILDELIKEAENDPNWKATSALRCAKREIEKILAPKRPESVEDYSEEDGDELWISYYICPNCFAGVSMLDCYCRRCGQALDWESHRDGYNAITSYYDERK